MHDTEESVCSKILREKTPLVLAILVALSSVFFSMVFCFLPVLHK